MKGSHEKYESSNYLATFRTSTRQFHLLTLKHNTASCVPLYVFSFKTELQQKHISQCATLKTSVSLNLFHVCVRYALLQLAEALRYTPESSGFDYRWGL